MYPGPSGPQKKGPITQVLESNSRKTNKIHPINQNDRSESVLLPAEVAAHQIDSAVYYPEAPGLVNHPDPAKRHPTITAHRWSLLDTDNLEEANREFPWLRGIQRYCDPAVPIYYQVTNILTRTNFQGKLVFTGVVQVRCESCRHKTLVQTNYVRRGLWRCVHCVQIKSGIKTEGYRPVIRYKEPQHGTLYEALRMGCICHECVAFLIKYNAEHKEERTRAQAIRRKLYGRGGKKRFIRARGDQDRIKTDGDVQE